MQTATSTDLLEGAAAELAAIRRSKNFAQWNAETGLRLDVALAETEPFRDYRNTWIFTGDGGPVAVSGRSEIGRSAACSAAST
ncbi:hypothetical protein [Aurantimonas coralicida]|uniref:hypothetical protein n=1 Tax=Aurantimonas coralicida TaxID=182270 RepID=UPI003559A6FD